MLIERIVMQGSDHTSTREIAEDIVLQTTPVCMDTQLQLPLGQDTGNSITQPTPDSDEV